MSEAAPGAPRGALRSRREPPRAASTSPVIYLPGNAPRPHGPRPSPGRKPGKPHGSHIAGLYEQRQTIWLCRNCAYKFDYKRWNYYREKYYVIGDCDACKEKSGRNQLFIHESYLTGPGGRSHHGCSWIPS